MTWSLKQALSSQGWMGTKSVARDLFGYRQERVPTNVDGSTTSVSLRWWATRDPKRSFHLNVILVGPESFDDDMVTEVDMAVHRIRQVFDAAGVAVLWVRPWRIRTADAGGLDVLTTSDEVDNLLKGWAVDNAGIDLYFPAGFSVPSGDGDLLGRSALPGPCPGEKKGKGPKGSVAGLGIASDTMGITTSGRTAAHEVGHYLSLEHRNSSGGNLMCQTRYANSPDWQQVALTSGQVSDVRDHCMVKNT